MNNYKQKLSKSICILACFLLVFFIAGCQWNPFSVVESDENEDAKVSFETDSGTHEFAVSVADTREERSLGLMYEESLDDNKGMLFVFEDSGKHSFWMKNTLIPLDMIFIDEDKKIIDIFKETEPCKVKNCPHFIPKDDALYVLEINGGKSDEIGIEIEDEVKFYNI